MPQPNLPKTPPLLVHAVWAIVAAATFCAGYMGSGGSAPSASSASAADPKRISGSARSAKATEGAGANSAFGKSDEESKGVLTSAQAKERVFYCLAKTNRIERLRLLCELLPLMDKDNWRDFEDAFSRQETKEYRVTTLERELLAQRLGQVVGAEGVEEALAENKGKPSDRAGLLAQGWASSDPEHALAWYKNQTPELQHGILGPFLTGLSVEKPKEAMELVLPYGEDEKDYCVWRIVNNAVQRDGFHGAEQLLASMMADPSLDGDGDVRGKMFISLLHRRQEVAEAHGQTVNELEWFDNYVRPNGPAGPHATGMIISSAAAQDPAGTAKWLDERSDRLTPTQQQAAYGAVVGWLLNASPEQYLTWMDQHQDHPQYDTMVRATAPALMKRGMAEDAQRLVQNVKNEQLRTELQTALSKPPPAPGAIRPSR